MASGHKLKDFMVKVLAVEPHYGSIYDNGIPAMAMPNMGAEVVTGLRTHANTFGKAYSAGSVSADKMCELAASLEGAVMAAVTVGVIAEQDADSLADELHSLLNDYQ